MRRLNIPLLAKLFAAVELTPEALFREYVSKNVLNHFRQDRGYKTGEYKKTWDGAEDNVHMVQLLDGIGDLFGVSWKEGASSPEKTILCVPVDRVDIVVG